MTPKSRITVDTKTVRRSNVEDILRRHRISYDLAGTEQAADEIERDDDQSPYQLHLPERATDAERAFLDKFTTEQERSARYLYAHLIESRDVFVTEDVRCFGEPGSGRRRALSTLVDTAILSFEEFKLWCTEHRAN